MAWHLLNVHVPTFIIIIPYKQRLYVHVIRLTQRDAYNVMLTCMVTKVYFNERLYKYLHFKTLILRLYANHLYHLDTSMIQIPFCKEIGDKGIYGYFVCTCTLFSAIDSNTFRFKFVTIFNLVLWYKHVHKV